MSAALKILEIGDFKLMREAYPATTDHWSTSAAEDFRSDGPNERLVTFAALPRLARALADPIYDLVVVQPGNFSPWQWQAISRSFFRRAALRGKISYSRYFGQEMVRRGASAPVAIWDWDEPPFIYRRNVFLLDRATLFFKRELPPDHWRVFMATLHHKVPTPRFRMLPKNRARIAKLRPISLGVPLGTDSHPDARPVADDEKTFDVFFAGRVEASTTVRQRGLAELLALREQGYRIHIPDNNLSMSEFLKRCAQSWLTWSPEGFGYECFRTYEAALCGSVPVISRQTVDRYNPLREGEHCFYHDVEPGGLTAVIERALQDREKLATMAAAARAFVLKNHTHATLARYVAETTLAEAKRLASSVLPVTGAPHTVRDTKHV